MKKASWLSITFIFSLSPWAFAQPQPVIKFPAQYAYQFGDSAAWARPEYADAHWPRVETQSFPQAQWQGIGWLRYVLEVDSSQWEVPLGLSIQLWGAAEFYLDGKLIYCFGQPGKSLESESASFVREPKAITFTRPKFPRGNFSQHVVAIRYSSQLLKDKTWAGVVPQLHFQIANLESMASAHLAFAGKITFHQMLLVGINLAFSLLHLMLFCFYPRLRANLYYAALTVTAACNIFFELALPVAATPMDLLWVKRGAHVTFLLFTLAWLRFMYALIHSTIPKIFIIFVIGSAGLGVWSWLQPFAANDFVLLMMLVALAELGRVLMVARLRKRDETMQGSWIIEIGAIPLLAAAAYQILTSLKILQPWWSFYDLPAPFYGQLGLTISMSIFLARYVANINKNLEAKLVEVTALSQKALEQERLVKQKEIERAHLEAENARKTRELEEARQLQLSMLPKAIPRLPHFDIAVHMQTATEVGGDYYDFKVAPDNTLTLAIGDATGHGMRAGTMVAATKSLFNVLEKEPETLMVLKQASQALKGMGFRQMYMAMTMAKFQHDSLQLSAAGMPFTLIYRAACQEVEAVELRGMPLGSVFNFPYQTAKLQLHSGDTLLFMSDGFPELFNEQGEILGYDEVKKLFAQAAGKTAQEVITHLLQAGKTWAGPRPPDDDITFIVIRFNPLRERNAHLLG